ncbi:hypothetical protein HYPSUDRAFT_67111 [Hypholoma sublateritium FD-334 SS-4]|uniref:Uncharacterized protein n=1 Tax=Hypholoma sublateritium (strain FD-334 SS-4) TaxID=945553 RepID=A0A0D2P160_HYPSF|nr:hypothetical protein HYPSUDRAFT_67111 [Hypholoma sublateritium FD-334 SS-4]
MSIYVFDQKDILNSSVRLASGIPVLSTATKMSIIHRDHTTLYGLDRRPIGSIRWKGGAFELQGTTKSTDLIKTKPPSQYLLDSNWERIWQWDPAAGPRYEIRFIDHQWIATELSTNAVHALMDPYESHLFRKSTPAAITFPEGVRDFDKWFLFLILLRMETRRLERRRRSSRFAVNQGAFGGGAFY